MPLWHCNSCHHEWEGGQDDNRCDWCNDKGHIIMEKTGLEQMTLERPKCTTCGADMDALYFMGEMLEGFVCPKCNQFHPWIDGKLCDPVATVIQ
jgi:predicted RNA-binding Zn-ribbon protein involved in translation (DUF1610 family)